MSSSSSDEDYDVTLLKEAIATDFISDSVFQGNWQPKNTMAGETSVKSLRPKQDEEDMHFNELGVTQEFQKHVAKHLVKLLDNSLQDKFNVCLKQLEEKRKKKKGGVKLLTNSTRFIKCAKDDNKLQAVTKRCNVKRHLDADNDEDYKNKLRSISVDPEYILSKKETQHWSKRSKAEIFHYKLKENGQLCLIDT